MNSLLKYDLLKLAIKNQLIISKVIDKGLVRDARMLLKFDEFISSLFIKSLESFNFVSAAKSKRTLFVGEGNFSFSLAITKKLSGTRADIASTVYETEPQISEEALNNSKILRRLGVGIFCGVDAIKLESCFGNKKFDNIIFQFPNAGSREAEEGRNPNFILLRDFLNSANNQLFANGCVIISVVNSTYYDGAFSFDEAAKEAGFLKPKVYKFDPNDFAGYNHTMTNEEDSAIEDYKSFKTLVFRKNL